MSAKILLPLLAAVVFWAPSASTLGPAWIPGPTCDKCALPIYAKSTGELTGDSFPPTISVASINGCQLIVVSCKPPPSQNILLGASSRGNDFALTDTSSTPVSVNCTCFGGKTVYFGIAMDTVFCLSTTV